MLARSVVAVPTTLEVESWPVICVSQKKKL